MPFDQSKVEVVKRALVYLSDLDDDRAGKKNGVGFNGRDSKFGNDLANCVRQGYRMTDNQLLAGLKVLRTYRSQLAAGGINIPESLESTAPKVEGPPRPDSSRFSSFSANRPQQTSSLHEKGMPSIGTAAAQSRQPAPTRPERSNRYEGPSSYFDDVPSPDERHAPVEASRDYHRDSYTQPGRGNGAGRRLAQMQQAEQEERRAAASQVVFEGKIIRVMFPKSGMAGSDGFVIAACTVEKIHSESQYSDDNPATLAGRSSVTVKGKLFGARAGAEFKITGRWKADPGRGMQIEVISAVEIIPETQAGLVGWLTMIDGIGPKIAEAIIDHFGIEDCSRILTDTPERVREVKGIGDAKAEEIARSIRENKDAQEQVKFLSGIGLSHAYIARVREKYGEKTIELVRANPYRLAEDIEGIGFLRADKIAQNMGVEPDSPFRIWAGVMYAIDEACGEGGHCFVGHKQLVDKAFDVLAVRASLIEKGIADLIQEKKLVQEDSAIYRAGMYHAERDIAQMLLYKLQDDSKMEPFDMNILMQWQEEQDNKLSDEQLQAVVDMCTSRVVVITGGPGSGKSFTMKTGVEMLERMGISVMLAAPTGRASRRLAESTGRNAETIHRLLASKRRPDGEEDPQESRYLNCDAFLVDEASMVDVPLFHQLLRNLRPECHLIMVGDIDQLPSVGPGSVLRDLIQCGKIPVARLTKVFRQAQQSMIVMGARAINAGEYPRMVEYRGPESLEVNALCFKQCESANDVQDAVVQVMYDWQERLMSSGRDDGPFETSQVLAPMRKMNSGVAAMNTRLQQEFNGESEPVLPKSDFRKGDKVMHIKNNRKLRVFNGDVGYVQDYDKAMRKIMIRYDDRVVPYEMADLNELVLAYSCTIHKCVRPDTLVETPDGLFRIEQIPATGQIASPSGAKSYGSKVVNPVGRMLAITTKDGYELHATPEHGVDVWDGTAYVRRDAWALRVGDFVRVKLGATFDPVTQVELPPPPSAGKAVQHRIPQYLTPDVAEFFGLMVADGTVYRAGFRLAKRHPEVVERFTSLVRSIFGVEAHYYLINGRTPCAEVNSTYLSKWLTNVGGMSPEDKAIPGSVMRSSLAIHAAFLRGLFEDGSVHVKSGKLDHIEWSSVYPSMRSAVRLMLLRLGIISGANVNRPYVIYIYGQNAVKFRDLIGFIANSKNERLLEEAGDETRYLVPVSKNDVAMLRRSTTKDIHPTIYNNAKTRGYMSRHCLERLLESVESEAQNWIAGRLQYHHTAIQSIEVEQSESMCVEVPDGHQFLQNGFAGWNSQGSEYELVIQVCHSSHNFMNCRQLLYTGETRGKKVVVIIGDRSGIEKSIHDARIAQRNTRLQERLRSGLTEALLQQLREMYEQASLADGEDDDYED